MLVPYNGKPTEKVQTIMNNFVTKTSKKCYTNENVLLMLWLFDMNAEEYLHDWVVEKAWKANDRDEEENESARKKGKKPMRHNLRQVFREALERSNQHDQNCPVILQRLTFNLFSHYVTTRKKNGGGSLSKSTYGSIRSAFKYLHKMAGSQVSEEYERSLTQFNRGMIRQITTEKAEKGVSLEEGKKAMNMDVYRLMTQILMKSGSDDATFAHVFLVLEWNLMARSDNCKNLRLVHIEWRHDCLVFFFGKTKGDQTGENSNSPWHVYSNPFEPSLCPVVALGKYLLSNPDLIKSDGPLFPGNDQYNRFIKIFNKVIEDNQDEFRLLGVDDKSLGSHSTRKGAITVVSTGCTVSPPMASICLRAGWSMGNVKDRYIHYEKAGDQYCGRAVTGISSLTKDFATSPVYWDFSESGETGKKAVKTIIHEKFVEASEVEPHVFELVRYFFAAFCYHYDYLDKTLAPSDKLQTSTLFSAAKDFEFCAEATTKYPWTATKYTPQQSGIPPHTMLLVELEKMKLALKEQTTMIVSCLKDELDDRSVGGMQFEAKQLLQDVSFFVEFCFILIQCTNKLYLIFIFIR